MFDVSGIDASFLANLEKVLLDGLGVSHAGLRLEIVSAARQSSFLLIGKNESVVCFDLAQSLVLRTLFQAISNGADYMPLADTLKECIAVSLARQNCSYAEALSRCQILAKDDHYVHPMALLAELDAGLGSLRRSLGEPLLGSLTDVFLLSHELFHYMKSRGTAPRDVFPVADDAFDFAVSQCCYENQPNFEEIATSYGFNPMGTDGLTRIRKDLINRRRHYEANREHLIEEIASDAFAFSMFIRSGLVATQKRAEAFFDFLVFWFYCIFVLADLHQAMNRRGDLSVIQGIRGEKPGSIADSNLRRTAVLAYSTNLSLQLMPPFDGSSETAQQRLAYLSNGLLPLKRALDGLYVMPITRAMVEALASCEEVFPKQASSGADSTSEDIDYQGRFDLLKLFPPPVRRSVGL